MRRLSPGISLCLILSAILSACIFYPAPQQEILGIVVDGETQLPIPGALVTLRNSTYQTKTNQEGVFNLLIPIDVSEAEITAWVPGYYIAYNNITPPVSDLRLDLRMYHTVDHRGYTWIDPTPESGENACGNCHPMILPQWGENAHGNAIANQRFFSFYNGTSVDGVPLDAPGYINDFPGTSGNCAACHAPGAAIDDPFNTDMNQVREQITAGIQCDFCHKVGGVYLKPTNQGVYANAPGILSIQTLRPPEGEQIFIGPYPDIHDPDTYHPVFSQSDFCAPCHQFSFWGTEIYNSFGEWLDSDYAKQGVTCQDCHMPPSGDEYFALIDQGGLPHPSEKIPSHFQLGIRDEEFMREAIDIETSYQMEGDLLHLHVKINNTAAGHDYPTDHPGRHLILVVSAKDASGNDLTLLSGEKLPNWSGDYKSKPGIIIAKILQDARTGEFPVVDYWNPTLIKSDNRLQALHTQEYQFVFSTNGSPVLVEVELLFRRMYQPIATIYGWNLGEILLGEESFIVEP